MTTPTTVLRAAILAWLKEHASLEHGLRLKLRPQFRAAFPGVRVLRNDRIRLPDKTTVDILRRRPHRRPLYLLDGKPMQTPRTAARRAR